MVLNLDGLYQDEPKPVILVCKCLPVNPKLSMNGSGKFKLSWTNPFNTSRPTARQSSYVNVCPSLQAPKKLINGSSPGNSNLAKQILSPSPDQRYNTMAWNLMGYTKIADVSTVVILICKYSPVPSSYGLPGKFKPSRANPFTTSGPSS